MSNNEFMNQNPKNIIIGKIDQPVFIRCEYYHFFTLNDNFTENMMFTPDCYTLIKIYINSKSLTLGALDENIIFSLWTKTGYYFYNSHPI